MADTTDNQPTPTRRRDTRITTRLPAALLDAIEREAERDQRTVSDVVRLTLEARFVTGEAR